MIFQSPHSPITIPDCTASKHVLHLTEALADKPALVEGPSGRTLTYGDLRTKSEAVARGLADRGLERGGVVAICSPNVPEYAVAFHGVAMAGGCSTTLNPLNTEDELVHQLNDSGARWFITIPALMDKAKPLVDSTTVEEIIVFGEAKGATSFDDLIAAGTGSTTAPAGISDPSKDLLTLPYSSGTTGRPKGVMLTHSNIIANVEQYLTADPVLEHETVIAVLPFFHIYGMVVIMSACLRAGATIVTMPRFDLAQFLETIAKYQVNRVYAVPPVVLALAKHPMVDDYDLSSIDTVMSGAAPLGAEVALACKQRLECSVYQGYGLTEASPVTHVSSASAPDETISSVGQTVSSTEMLVIDLDSGDPVGPETEGEIWVRGPQVMAGYLNNPKATARTVDSDGWLHTGDVGRVDNDGYLTIVDRAKELIKYKGFQVPPAELEDVLLSHSAVKDAAVIPVQDDEAGEVPKAFVVLVDATDGEGSGEQLWTAELLAYVAERVAPYKKIRLMEFVDQIPKSASGKILRRILVERERARSHE